MNKMDEFKAAMAKIDEATTEIANDLDELRTKLANSDGGLSEQETNEAISMLIDRAAILKKLGQEPIDEVPEEPAPEAPADQPVEVPADAVTDAPADDAPVAESSTDEAGTSSESSGDAPGDEEN